MATSPRRSGALDPVITCPRCKVPAQQQWGTVHWHPAGRDDLFSDEAVKDQPHVKIHGEMVRRPVRWHASLCSGCGQKSLWRGDATVYPLASAAPAPHALMDPDVKSLYDEAGQVLPISRRAGAALIRAALEKQVRQLDIDAPKGTKLDGHIARISTRVSTPLAELLDVIRHVGNSSLHGSGDDELVYLYLNPDGGTADIAELLFDAINDLVDELVARPAAARTLWEKLPEGVRNNIKKKRADQGTQPPPASAIDA